MERIWSDTMISPAFHEMDCMAALISSRSSESGASASEADKPFSIPLAVKCPKRRCLANAESGALMEGRLADSGVAAVACGHVCTCIDDGVWH